MIIKEHRGAWCLFGKIRVRNLHIIVDSHDLGIRLKLQL